ncbi:MAG: hypothetical protein LBR52_00055 [Prevotellaceae bacterium]|jgi:hypothetical protein|nr:hypothetical protein [Prevotellaceae bacterium]
MKTTKILAAVLGLFLATSVNIVSAQNENMERNDSIYGLELSIEDNIMNLSFYSTYNMEELKGIGVQIYDGTSNDWEVSSYWGGLVAEYNNGSFFTKEFGEISIEAINENLHKININNTLLNDFFNGKPLKFRCSITGEGYAPPASNLREGIIGRSNILTFFFNPLATPTSLMELETDKNYIYKYYLLSGIEIKKLLAGVPLIREIYDENKLIATDKIMINK